MVLRRTTYSTVVKSMPGHHSLEILTRAKEEGMLKVEKNEKILIVGGGPGSRILNHYLHMLNPDVNVTLIRDEDRIANHCSIPYVIDGRVSMEKGLAPEETVTKFGTPIIKEKVITGNPDAKYVVTDKGNRYSYDRLIFATGSRQLVPPIEGVDLGNILKIRAIDDFRETIEVRDKAQSFVVLGAGYIGLEIAAGLRRLGKDVTIIELMPHVAGGRYDVDFMSMLEKELEEHGIKLYLGKKAAKFGGNGSVEYVELDDGTIIKTDAVILSTGIVPRVDYAKDFGIETAKGGIIINEFLETSTPYIYALGDCVQTKLYLTDKPFPGELGSNAAQMARILALNFNGYQIPFNGVINPAVTTLFDIHFGSAGITEIDAQREGIDIYVGKAKNTDIYGNMPETRPLFTKVLFRKDDKVIVGGEIIGTCNVAGFVDVLGQLIYRKATLEEVVTMHFSTHPEMTPDPAHPYFVFAAQQLLAKGKA